MSRLSHTCLSFTICRRGTRLVIKFASFAGRKDDLKEIALLLLPDLARPMNKLKFARRVPANISHSNRIELISLRLFLGEEEEEELGGGRVGVNWRNK